MWSCADTTAEREERGNLTTHLLQLRGVGDDVGRLAAELLQGGLFAVPRPSCQPVGHLPARAESD